MCGDNYGDTWEIITRRMSTSTRRFIQFKSQTNECERLDRLQSSDLQYSYEVEQKQTKKYIWMTYV